MSSKEKKEERMLDFLLIKILAGGDDQSTKKIKTLADLFRPPVDLIEAGSFENVWLLHFFYLLFFLFIFFHILKWLTKIKRLKI